jgi:hypothetical protein
MLFFIVRRIRLDFFLSKRPIIEVEILFIFHKKIDISIIIDLIYSKWVI